MEPRTTPTRRRTRRPSAHRAQHHGGPRRALATLALAGLTATVFGTAPVMAAPQDWKTGQTVHLEKFDRATTRGWATSAGVQYVTADPAQASIASGTGRVKLAPGKNVRLAAPGVSAGNVRASVSIAPAAIPTAGNGPVGSLELRAKDGKSYRGSIRFGREGKASITVHRVDGGKLGEALLVSDKLLPGRASAKKAYTLEVQVAGASPVEISVRAWPTGTTAPGWQATTTDSSSRRITQNGAAQVRTFLSSTSAAQTLTFDNLRVQSVVAVAPATPTTSPTPAPTPTPTRTATPTPTPTPSATPAPSPTAAPTTAPAPTPAPTTAPPAAPAPTTGSLPVGSATYPVPAGAVFATAAGNYSGAGTAASPYGSAKTAIEKAPSGSTVVLRGGLYRETVTVPFNKKLTIQAYPGEAVWFEGSAPIPSWTPSGAVWTAPFDKAFDTRVSFTAGKDETSRWVDPAHPLANLPEQLWVNGTELTQVGSAGEVRTGTFYVDRSAKRIVLGTNPYGKTVETSVLTHAMKIQGEGTTVRGIGVRRYANHLALMGAVTAEVPGITLENVVISDNAMVGLYAWAKGHVFTQLTINGNGLMGIGANKADSLRLERSLLSGNNTERFKLQPASGNLKITESRGVRIVDNVVEKSPTTGLWFDVYSKDVHVVGNTLRNNEGAGLIYELSENLVAANNHIVNNGRAGIEANNSGHVQIWNNTITGNKLWTVRLLQDERRGTGEFPLLVNEVDVHNNVFDIPQSSSCPMLVDDLQDVRYAKDMNLAFNGNLYARTSASSPSNLVCWAVGSGGIDSIKSLSQFSSATGNEPQGKLLEGTTVLGATLALTDAVRGSTTSVPVAVPSSIATTLGVATGWRGLGPTVGARG